MQLFPIPAIDLVRRSRRTLAIAAMLAVLSVAGLSVAAPHRLSAQTPDCEDPDVVACIPTTGTSGTSSSGSSNGPATALPAAPIPAGAASAAAAPAAPPPIGQPPIPAPCPYDGYYYPGPVPASAAPYYCVNSIYSSINRANLVYARAMRSLDASSLPTYWGQDALQQLRDQINGLQASGSYRVLRLASIQVLEQTVGSDYAWVHTTEHWLASTWSNSGYQYDSADRSYDNQYYLYRIGGRWIIGTDVVS